MQKDSRSSTPRNVTLPINLPEKFFNPLYNKDTGSTYTIMLNVVEYFAELWILHIVAAVSIIDIFLLT